MAYTKRDKTTSESEIFFLKPDKRFKIWFYIVGEVHRQDYKQRKRGENWFSYDKITHATGASKQQIRKCLERLRNRSMIETNKEIRGLTIKVLNYAKYQDINKSRGDKKETRRRQQGDTEVDTIEEEYKNKEYIIINGTVNSEVDECIKKQIRELGFPKEGEDATKYKILVELIAMGLKVEKNEKAILSRLADIEKKLDANGFYVVDYIGGKTYDYQKGWNVATNLRERQYNQGKPSGNVLNSYAKFLSNNKKK